MEPGDARAAGWEDVGKTKGFSRVGHARDFYIPNGRPKVLFMKPFRRDAWDLVVSNDLPDEYDVAAHLSKWLTAQHGKLARHLAADGKFVDEVVGLVSVVDAESGDVVAVAPASRKEGLKGRCEYPVLRDTLAGMDLSGAIAQAIEIVHFLIAACAGEVIYLSQRKQRSKQNGE